MSQTVAVQAKPMITSTTFWVNLLVAVLAFLSEIQAILPDFADILSIPPEVSRWVLFLTAVLNIVLRRLSDAPARFTTQPEPVQVERFEG